MESSQRENTDKMRTIEMLAEQCCIPVVDTIAPFQNNYDSFVSDSVHPNDSGHMIYCDAIMDVISQLVEEQHEFDPSNISPINELASRFDSFSWLGLNSLKEKEILLH